MCTFARGSFSTLEATSSGRGTSVSSVVLVGPCHEPFSVAQMKMRNSQDTVSYVIFGVVLNPSLYLDIEERPRWNCLYRDTGDPSDERCVRDNRVGNSIDPVLSSISEEPFQRSVFPLNHIPIDCCRLRVCTHCYASDFASYSRSGDAACQAVRWTCLGDAQSRQAKPACRSFHWCR